MRMATHELCGDVAGHVVEIEPARILRDLRVEDRLQQQVTEFLAQICLVAEVDRLDDFIRFLNQSRAQRGVRLLDIPRATAGPAQLRHDLDELVDAGLLRVGWGKLGGHEKR